MLKCNMGKLAKLQKDGREEAQKNVDYFLLLKALTNCSSRRK